MQRRFQTDAGRIDGFVTASWLALNIAAATLLGIAAHQAETTATVSPPVAELPDSVPADV
ncbi:hypothetical protein [Kitasatospora cheerisanensis]|uniref:Uncharacterized protein n=1 Tax=Kitasatospora cheerisanensis KCTC 2395 TaxID=1348663 RepID=A0A066YXZ0_9ACTN|nr:hypothetical protein [Kitasatospora cheerisanensis]KDN82775.1 hypothetical protein KCH_55100 [Kitasatospora cheerisanensis KCTC 2395]